MASAKEKDLRKLWQYLHTTRDWAKGAVMQGERVLALQQKMTIPPNAPPHVALPIMRCISELGWLRNAEDHFFVIALDRVFSWLKAGSNVGLALSPKFVAAAAAFEIAFPKRKLPRTASNKAPIEQSAPEAIRDMREHEIEYLGFGKEPGRLQPAYVQPVQEGTKDIACDASSVVVTNDGYLIGGWLNVQQGVTAAEGLMPTLDQEFSECQSQLSACIVPGPCG